jgi:eukaryotic-like serine/threonine-protein kinase
MACPSDDTFGRRFSGRLSEVERQALTAHMRECAACTSMANDLDAVRTITRVGQEATLGEQELPATARPSNPGSLAAEKYQLGERLGRGTSAEVFACTERQTGEALAMKILHASLRNDALWIARFSREAKLMRNVQHEALAAVRDFGWFADGRPFVVMERIHGISLEAHVAARGWLPAADAVELLLQICAGLSSLHGAGLVHRDLKPGNIILSAGPNQTLRVKIVDFGLVRDTQDRAAGLTPDHALLGTPHFMAPEQIQDPRAIDHRADIWAVGVLAYRLLSGVLPFEGAGTGQVIAQILAAKPERMRRHAETPLAIEAIVHRCLHRDPAQRFQDAQALALALSLAGTERSNQPRSEAPRSASRSTNRILLLTSAIAVLFLVLGGLAGWLTLRMRR